MKKINLKIFIIALNVIFFISFKTVAQVGIGTTTPDVTSMLDIQSTSKGVLIPRMTTLQREGISAPTTGLLVFDNTTQSFWFHSSSWTELATGSPKEIIDVDGDTKIEVEQSTDEDKIRFTTLDSERMTIDNAGNTRIGDGTNNTYIESDGSLRYEGEATRWDDLKVPVSSTTKGGTKDPAWAVLKNDGSSQGVFLQWFSSSNEEELYFVMQMPHAWKEGSEIYPHVHWTAKSDVSTNKVVWGLEYTWTNVGSLFGDTTIITGSDPIAPVGTVSAYEHAITSLGTITAIGYTLSSVLVCRVFRKANDAADTYGSDAGLLEIDFHHQIDSDGSRQEYIK